ncbi:MAG: DUF4157 domain-containing protein [Chloroflexota bacterium]|nr:DUF4157 domain-containing protein [Chloroflexota bacterium]
MARGKGKRPGGGRPAARTSRKGSVRSPGAGKPARHGSHVRVPSPVSERTPDEVAEHKRLAMLGDGRLSHTANAAQKADVLNMLQQGYGNAYVQRVVDRIRARRDDGLSSRDSSAGIERGIAGERGAGRPLEPRVSSEMGERFGRGLDDVRVHDDAAADGLAKGLGARAFTVGGDVFFRHGSYAPDSVEGQRLLAHELTHVVQQTGGKGGGQAPVQFMPDVAPDVDMAIRKWLSAEPAASILKPEALAARVRSAIPEASGLSDDDVQAVYHRWKLSRSLTKPLLPMGPAPTPPAKEPVGGSALADTVKKVTDAFKSIPTQVKVSVKGGSVVVDASGATSKLKVDKATLTAAAGWNGNFKIGASYRGSGSLAAGQMVNLSASVNAKKYSISLRIGPSVTAIDKLPDIVEKAEEGLGDLLSDIGSLNLESLDDVKASAGRIADHVKSIKTAVDACSKLEGARTGGVPPIFLSLKAQFPTAKGKEEGVPTSVMGMITIPF